MSYISSINFKKSTSFQVFHNANIRPSYAIGGEIECTLKGYEAEALKNELIAEAKKAYEANRKKKAPKFKAKSFEWSAVVNIKPDSTMPDLENLAKHFNEKYGFQCYQIAIHRDEGHINEQGEKVINHHAHLEFITLDKNTGKNIYNRANITPTKLRQMQTEVADILGMERGVDKRLSGAKRVEPRAFAKIKEQERKQQEALKLEIAKNKEETKNLTTENETLYAENKFLNSENETLNTSIEALKTKVKDLEFINELQNTQITTLQNDLKEEKEKSKEVLEELEKLRKESKNKELPKEYFQGINQLKKLMKTRQINEAQRFYGNFVKNYEGYKLVTKEFVDNFIEIESLFRQVADLNAKNNSLTRQVSELKSYQTSHLPKSVQESVKTSEQTFTDSLKRMRK